MREDQGMTCSSPLKTVFLQDHVGVVPLAAINIKGRPHPSTHETSRSVLLFNQTLNVP